MALLGSLLHFFEAFPGDKDETVTDPGMCLAVGRTSQDDGIHSRACDLSSLPAR